MTKKSPTFGYAICSLATVAALSAPIVGGCVGFAGSRRSDPPPQVTPAHKIDRTHRLLTAKRLFMDAAEFYKRKGDDLNLAEVYRRYAHFVRENGEVDPARYDGVGAPETPANDDNRMDISIRYFEKALEIVERHEHWSAASTLYYDIAKSHRLAGRNAAACAALDRSLDANRKANPIDRNRMSSLPPNIDYFDAVISKAKRESKCP